MAEEPEISLPSEEPRRCPACGSRVAAKASTCLMCGASLIEEEEAAPEEEQPQGLPGWASALIVVGLTVLILVLGAFGLHKLMAVKPEPTATPMPTRTPTPTVRPRPTRTPTPTTKATPIPPLVHQVQQGDTLSSIAAEYGTVVETILALNPGVEPESLPVGYLLLIPAGTLTPTPTATLDPNVPTPTPGDFVIHVVVPGETLSAIAEYYGVSVGLIRAANPNLPSDDTIQVNQSLVIPIGTPLPSPVPTVDPNATPTPIPPYTSPPLLSPPDGAVLVGTSNPVLLQWASVSVLRGDEWYALTLFQPGGGAISSTIYTRATAWRVPPDLLLATGADECEFHWQVQIVREDQASDGTLIYAPAGAPSRVRTFVWLEPTPTPAATPTLAPSPTSAP